MSLFAGPESRQVAELSRAFDESFAAPAVLPASDLLSLIAIRLGGEALLMRVDHIGGIARCPRVTPVPSHSPALMGIVGMRGALTPVFSLAAMLELPRAPTCAWLTLVRRESLLAFAFDGFDGRIEVPSTCLFEDQKPNPRRFVRQLARVASRDLAVVDIQSIAEAIEKEIPHE
jgi:chemotaxis signal transduction protein